MGAWTGLMLLLKPLGEDGGYKEFFESVDVLVMGRKTFEKVLSFGAWPYAEVKVVVMSQRVITFPDRIPECVSHSSEDPSGLVERLSSEGAQHLYVDGGQTIQRFLAEGLIEMN